MLLNIYLFKILKIFLLVIIINKNNHIVILSNLYLILIYIQIIFFSN